MRQKVKLFDNKIDLKLYKLIIIFYGESTVMQYYKGPKNDPFNNFMYREDAVSNC